MRPTREHLHPLRPDYPARAFAGTADLYARYRPQYPSRLLDALLQHAGPGGAGRLLDLACGPGELALALHASFREVWAIDQEPEMIAEGQRRAAGLGITNIRWLIGRAEDLDAPAGHFGLITAGRAFHRLHKDVITERARTWLRRGGYLADLGAESGVLWGRDEPWQHVAHEAVRRWTQPPRDLGVPAQPMVSTFEVLRGAGFTDIEEYRVWTPFTWTADTLLGYFRSMSATSDAALGDRAPGFAADLRASLLACDPADQFPELIESYYRMARVPA